MDSPRHDALIAGARLFDHGAFFEAHEAWEARWRVETDAEARRFFQGLIQVAAGFHKLFAMRDRASAARLVTKGLAKLDACSEAVGAAWLPGFRDELRGIAQALASESDAPSSAPRLGLVAAALEK